MDSAAEGRPFAISHPAVAMLFIVEKLVLVSFLHLFGVSRKVDSVRRRGLPAFFLCLGSTPEGGFCAQARVPGDLRAYWVRLGNQIPSLFW